MTQARAELDAVPLPSMLGLLAASAVRHDFVALSISQCLLCFGWRDDPRHPVVGGPMVSR